MLLKTYIQKLAGPHKFSTTQIEVGPWMRAKLKAYQKIIEVEDLTDEGLETTLHVTVKYGIHTENSAEIKGIIKDFGEIECTLGEVSAFVNDEHDVLKIDVESDDLHRLNKLVSTKTKCTDKYPEYIPHMTLAYLKPGRAEKYVGDKDFEGMKFSCDTVVFNNKAGDSTEIVL